MRWLKAEAADSSLSQVFDYFRKLELTAETMGSAEYLRSSVSDALLGMSAASHCRTEVKFVSDLSQVPKRPECSASLAALSGAVEVSYHKLSSPVAGILKKHASDPWSG